MRKKRHTYGFTLIEILVVVSIIGILSVGSLVTFVHLNHQKVLEKEVATVVAVINEAHSQTLASKNDSRYGVYFESHTFTSFKGASYVEGDSNNKVYSFDSNVTLSSSISGGTSIVFKRLTGDTDNDGTITISLKSDATQYTHIIISRTGIIDVE